MAIIYQYTLPSKYSVPAQVVGNICADLEKTDAGLTPDTLLDSARSEDSPIHSMFDWNDTTAAEKWRKEQARHIICDLVVKKVPAKEPVRAYVSVKKSYGIGQYKPIDKVVERPDWKSEMLMNAKRDMEAFIRKYEVLSSMDSCVDHVITVLKEYIEEMKKTA